MNTDKPSKAKADKVTVVDNSSGQSPISVPTAFGYMQSTNEQSEFEEELPIDVRELMGYGTDELKGQLESHFEALLIKQYQRGYARGGEEERIRTNAIITKAQIEVLEWVKSELKKSTLLEQDKFWDDITPMIDQEIARLRGQNAS